MQHHSHSQPRDLDKRFARSITPEQEQEVLRLGTTHSLRQIAAQVGISKSSVALILGSDSLDYQELVLDYARLRHHTPQELSGRLSLPVEFVRATLNRNHLPADGPESQPGPLPPGTSPSRDSEPERDLDAAIRAQRFIP